MKKEKSLIERVSDGEEGALEEFIKENQELFDEFEKL